MRKLKLISFLLLLFFGASSEAKCRWNADFAPLFCAKLVVKKVQAAASGSCDVDAAVARLDIPQAQAQDYAYFKSIFEKTSLKVLVRTKSGCSDVGVDSTLSGLFEAYCNDQPGEQKLDFSKLDSDHVIRGKLEFHCP